MATAVSVRLLELHGKILYHNLISHWRTKCSVNTELCWCEAQSPKFVHNDFSSKSKFEMVFLFDGMRFHLDLARIGTSHWQGYDSISWTDG